MKINKNFALRKVANTWVVLPLAEATVNLNGMLKLNESGVLLWNALEKESDRQELVSILTSEYEVSEEQARADVDEFLFKLIKVGCIDEQ